MSVEQLHFVTGRLAEFALRNELQRLATKNSFEFTIQVMPISVAALMTGEWISKRLVVPEGTTAVVLPGYAAAGLETVAERCKVPVRLGPKDLRDLATMFDPNSEREGFGPFDIEIIAEINHAPRLTPMKILSMAKQLVADGADVVDVGCDPDGGWNDIGIVVSMLRDEGIRTSVDSFDRDEVNAAIRAGAELVLSVNSTNCEFAVDWGAEVVVVPDDPARWKEMDATIERLDRDGVSFRIDPILEPVGIGFSDSLVRYHSARQMWPGLKIMMGIGNVTELIDADSAGINLLLLGACQEIGVTSVLTTQVINWARSSVRECDIARRIAKYAVEHRIPAKRISELLVIARDSRPGAIDQAELRQLAESIRDRNYRVFASDDTLSVLGDKKIWQNSDPFEIFDEMMETQANSVDPSHAFYLGFELCKAELANQLSKRYVQDETLDWGYLTQLEKERHRLRKRRSNDNKGTDAT